MSTGKEIESPIRASRLFLFGAIFALMVAAMLVLEYTNRNHGGLWLRDFQVFYRAAGRIISGQDVFQPARDGFYSYKYSPTAALLFVPFSLVPFAAAQVLYWLSLSALVLGGFYLCLAIVYPEFRAAGPGRTDYLVAIAGLVLAIHIWSELTLGQVNHLLLVMYVAIAWLFSRRRPALLAFVWAMSLFLKPYALIFLPYFLLKKRFRELGWLALFSGLLFLLPALFYGTHFLSQQHAWLGEIGLELGRRSDLLQPGNQTLVSVLARYSPLEFLQPGAPVLTAFKMVLLSLVGLLALWVVRKGRDVRGAAALDFAFLLTLAPLLSNSSDNTFGLVELAVFLLLFNFGKLTVAEKSLSAAAFLLIGGNFYNQLPFEWGTGFYQYYDSVSLLAIGAMLLLATITLVRRRAVL